MLLTKSGITAAAASAVGVPVNTVAPVVTGTTVVGQTLSCSTGTWTNTSGISYAYQWKRGATNVGTNAATYLLVAGDAGSNMTCVVTATNGSGAGAPATSNSVGPITSSALPLDAYTANLAMAFSFGRKLLTSYGGGPMQLRDGTTETEIGFSGNVTNASQISAFGGSGKDLRASVVYDQSGNARHYAQTVYASSLRVHLNGTNQTRNGMINGISFGGNAFMYGPSFSNYTGTTLSAYFVGTIGDVIYCRVIAALCPDSAADSNNTGAAALMLRNVTSNDIMCYRNGPVGGSGVTFTSPGTFFSGGTRFTGTDCFMRIGATTSSSGSTGAWKINQFLLMASTGTAAENAAGMQACEGAVWFGDIGDTAMQAILTEARTAWSAI